MCIRDSVIVVNHRDIPAGLVVDEVLGFRRFADAEFTADVPPTIVRCERYIAGSFRRAEEQWPVLGLRAVSYTHLWAITSPSFMPIGLLSTMPRAPRSLCSHTSATVWAKLPSDREGIAIRRWFASDPLVPMQRSMRAALHALKVPVSYTHLAQRLVMGTDNKRVAAVEVMLNTPHISELIKRGDVSGIKESIMQSGDNEVFSFDTSLHKLYQDLSLIHILRL